jgi:hypothetical protein
VANIDGTGAATRACFSGIIDEDRLAFAHQQGSNWHMDQCAIHMDCARTMLRLLWQTCCPILPQLAA